jgi:hypothetical protein
LDLLAALSRRAVQDATFAIDYFVYGAGLCAGGGRTWRTGYVTAGIGENSNICARVMEKLAWLGFFILRPMLCEKR